MEAVKSTKLWILYSGILLAMVGYGIAMPLLPFYIEEMGGRGTHLGLLIATYGLMQLIFAPIWGGLSDTYGRKPFLLLGLLGIALGMSLMGLADKLWMLYAAQGLSGMLSCGIYPSAMAMISDQYRKDQRSAAIGRVGAAAGLGVILGPGLGGFLSFHSLRTPFFVASGFAFVTFLLVAVLLPETLRAKEKHEEREKWNAEKTFIKKPKIRKERTYLVFAKALKGPLSFGLIAAFAVNFGKSNFTSIYGYFALEKFGYGPQEVGMILMVMSFMYAIAQGLLVGPLTKKFKEITLIRGVFAGISLAYLSVTFAGNGAQLVITMGLLMLMLALLKPVALTYIANRTDENQGAAMGIAESFMSMGRIAGPLWAGFIFDYQIHLPYLTGSLFFLLLLMGSILKKKRESYQLKEAP